MSRLFLLRHAKAQWAEPGQRDFDRALEPSGVEDAARLGRHLTAQGQIPSAIATSASRRTRQTVEALGWSSVPSHALDELYEATAVQALKIIRAQGTGNDLMLVGHNPAMEDLAMALVGGGSKKLQEGFPTCGLAIIHFDTGLAAAAPGTGRLTSFLRPSDLK